MELPEDLHTVKPLSLQGRGAPKAGVGFPP